MSILRIDSSARTDGSQTRAMLDRIEAKLGGAVTRRDVGGEALPQISGTWVGANFTGADERSEDQKEALALSDALIAEVRAAGTLLIGVPIYNFGIPASLKAWIDLVARAGVTFRYTPEGPVGLLEGKRAIVAVASGGTEAGSPIDFATPYMRHVLGFIGIHDVQFVFHDRAMADADAAAARAEEGIAALAA